MSSAIETSGLENSLLSASPSEDDTDLDKMNPNEPNDNDARSPEMSEVEELKEEMEEVDSTGIRSLEGIFKDLKREMHKTDDEGDSDNSDSDQPDEDDLNQDEMTKLHGDIVYIIENFNTVQGGKIRPKKQSQQKRVPKQNVPQKKVYVSGYMAGTSCSKYRKKAIWEDAKKNVHTAASGHRGKKKLSNANQFKTTSFD